MACPLLFAGQYVDGESGWAYNRFRFYSPSLGVYGAQDPLGVGPNVGSAQGYVTHPGCFVDLLGLQQGAHQKWVPKEVLGKKVYQQVEGQVFDPQMQVNLPVELGGGTGTNLDLMAAGRSPIGHDHKPVQLHHIGQRDDSSLVELTATRHSENTRTLHLFHGLSKDQFPRDVQPVDRIKFSAWREGYWKERGSNLT